MKTSRYGILALLFLGTGAGIVGYACTRQLPDVVAAESMLHQLVLHDTITLIDTLAPQRRERPVVSIYFSPGSSYVAPVQQERLMAAIKTLTNTDSMMLRLDGYSDPTGADAVDNNYLASQRSFAIYNLLIRNGIGKQAIYMRSFGAHTDATTQIDSVRRVDISLSEVLY